MKSPIALRSDQHSTRKLITDLGKTRCLNIKFQREVWCDVPFHGVIDEVGEFKAQNLFSRYLCYILSTLKHVAIAFIRHGTALFLNFQLSTLKNPWQAACKVAGAAGKIHNSRSIANHLNTATADALSVKHITQ